MSELQAALARADELAGDGRYFDAHEELEAYWMRATGENKILLQGLIQIAAGLHRLRLDARKTDGAFYLLDRGAQKLAKTARLLAPQPLADLLAEIARVRAAGAAPARLRFGLSALDA